MGRLISDLGILRAYYRRLLLYGVLGGGVLFILAGFLCGEAITAARGDLPLTGTGSLYLACVAVCLVLGGLVSLINWQATRRRLTEHLAANLAVDDLLLGAVVNRDGTYRDRPGHGYGYEGTPQAPPVVQQVKVFVRRYAELCLNLGLVPYPWDRDRGTWLLRNLLSALLVLMLLAALVLGALPEVLQMDIPAYISEGRWVPALGTALVFWFGTEMVFHSLARWVLARLVQDTITANPREFAALLQA